MADNIDQSMSLKAALKDEVSPALQKINTSVEKTKAALTDFGEKTRNAGQVILTAVTDMDHKNKKAQESIQTEVKKTGGAFQELGKEANASSQQVGAALDNAFRTGKSARTADELDDELGGLKRTLEGMASTNRPLSAKSKNMKALGSDTLNRKVIPAFQSLHDTLDSFPDALGGINAAGKEQVSLSQKMQQSLSAVNERVDGLGDTFNKLKFTMLDFVGAITTSFFGVQGAKLRKGQTSAAQQRGTNAFKEAENMIPVMQLLSRAPEDVWGPAYETLLDTSKLALHDFPIMIRQMTNLSKATGLSTGTFAEMFVQMKEISNLSGEEWIGVTKKINFFASESRASIEDIAQALAGSTEEMLGFSRAARKAYAEQSMVSAAQAANAGLSPGAGGDLFRTMQRDLQARAQASGLLQQQGIGFDLTKAARQGDVSGTFGNIADALAQFVEQQRAVGNNIQEGQSRMAFEARFGSFATPEMALKLAERRKELGAGGFVGEAARLNKEGKDVNFDALVGKVRGTGVEKIEQVGAILGATGMDIGKYTMEGLEKGLDPVLMMSANIATNLANMPEMSKQGIAFFSIGLNVMSGLEQVLRSVPGMGWAADMISGPLEKLLGATVFSGLATGNDPRDAAAAVMPNMPGLRDRAERMQQERESQPGGVYSVVPLPETPGNWVKNAEKGRDQLKEGKALWGMQVALAEQAKNATGPQANETKLSAAAGLLNASRERISQLNMLTQDKTLAKVRYFEENVRGKLADEVEQLKRDKRRAGTPTEIRSITTQIEAKQRVLDMSAADLSYSKNSGVLNSVVSDADVTQYQKQFQNEIRDIVRITDMLTDNLSGSIPQDQLNAQENLLVAQEKNNLLIAQLIASIDGKKNGITPAEIEVLVQALKDVPQGPVTTTTVPNGPNNPGTDRLDGLHGGRR